jgi:hypothetical protein
MSYQAALQKIEQAAAEQWEELDLAGIPHPSYCLINLALQG